jgi:hypothetical protein
MQNDRVLAVSNNRKFQVSCDADGSGRFRCETNSLWVKVGQRVRRHKVEEMWDSVTVACGEEQDGTLTVRIVVFNPDWDEPLQIACVRSRPQDQECLTALGCNLDHVPF